MSGTSANRPTQAGGVPFCITTTYAITPNVKAIDSQRCSWRIHRLKFMANPPQRDWIIFHPLPDGSRKPASTVP